MQYIYMYVCILLLFYFTIVYFTIIIYFDFNCFYRMIKPDFPADFSQAYMQQHISALLTPSAQFFSDCVISETKTLSKAQVYQTLFWFKTDSQGRKPIDKMTERKRKRENYQ